MWKMESTQVHTTTVRIPSSPTIGIVLGLVQSLLIFRIILLLNHKEYDYETVT